MEIDRFGVDRLMEIDRFGVDRLMEIDGFGVDRLMEIDGFGVDRLMEIDVVYSYFQNNDASVDKLCLDIRSTLLN